MQLGLIGLGKMGGNMRERVRRAGHEVVGYDTNPEVSDVESAIHSVSGVDNVRLLSSGDYPGWSYSSRNNFATGLQVVAGGSVIKTYITSNGHLQDAVFRDNESPIFESLTTQVKAQNTFLAS